MKIFAFLFLFLFLNTSIFCQTSTVNRVNDPMVIQGSDLSVFATLQPSDLVGFKFENGDWIQIPIQIDERVLLDVVSPYGNLASQAAYPYDPANPTVLFYTDPNTNIGNDTNPNFDSDDELVFMMKDLGTTSDGSLPTGAVQGSCNEIYIQDPLGGEGYIYLFEQDGSLVQDAGIDYVEMTTDVFNVAGFPAHTNGTNPENTTISSAKYSWGFSSEWVSDEYKLAIGNDADILDRHKAFFAPWTCVRTEDTFSSAENAYITIKDGPIRVIRSYMGANSGKITQRTHLFYEGRHDIITDLRVHKIPAIFDAFDYSPNANGMTYTDQLNPTGVIVDGNADNISIGEQEWMQLQGTQGTVSILYRLDSDIVAPTEASVSYYYDDNSANPGSTCTGDGEHWGTSGPYFVFVDQQNIYTDPLHANAQISGYNLRYLKATRTIYSDAANASANTASVYNDQMNNAISLGIGACCLSDLYIPNPIAGTYQVGGQIESDGLIPAATSTTFKANTILLSAGFDVGLNTDFTGEIDPCQ